MDKDTFLEKIKEIGSFETAEEMRAGLAEIQNGVAEVYDSNSSLSEQHERDTIEMEAIRQANMKLFTQLGTDKTPVKQAEEETVCFKTLTIITNGEILKWTQLSS